MVYRSDLAARGRGPPPGCQQSQGRIFSATATLKQPRAIQVRTSEIPDRVSSSEHATGARPQSPRGSAPTGFQEKLKEGFPEEEWKAFPRRKRKKLAHRRRVLGYVPWSSAAPAALQSQGRTEAPASRSQGRTETPASRSQESTKTPAKLKVTRPEARPEALTAPGSKSGRGVGRDPTCGTNVASPP